MLGWALAALSVLSLFGAGLTVRLGIKGEGWFGYWDMTAAVLLVLLSVALAASAGAAWGWRP